MSADPWEKDLMKKNTIFTMKHPPTQMIWRATSANAMGGTYFLKPGTTMNGAKYAELLKDKVTDTYGDPSITHFYV